MWFHTFIVTLWGGLLALERRAFLQAMLSRPLVAATTTGLLLGDGEAGVHIGLIFEFIHLGRVSLGASQAEHETLPATAACAFAAEAGAHASTPALWAIAIFLFSPAGALGRILEARLDLRAQKYFWRAVSASEAGQLERAARQNMRAMWPQFVFYGVLCGIAVVTGAYARPILALLPSGLIRGFEWSYLAMGVGATAIALQGMHAKRRYLAASMGAVAASIVLIGYHLLTRQ